MDLVDRQSGAKVAVPEADAIPALRSRKFGVMPGQAIPVVKDGVVGTIPAEQLGAAAAQGIRLASPDEVHKEAVEYKYGDRLSVPGLGHLATDVAALRGASAGLSDPAILAGARWLGGKTWEDKTRETLVGLKEANPWRTTGGEVGGMIAGAALMPGSSPIGGVAKVGGAVERGAASLLGAEATSFGGRALQGGLKYGMRGAAEGALVGAGNAASEAALEDKDLTAEKLLAGARGGALAGAALGAGFGVAGEAATTGARKLGQVASRSLGGGSVADALESFAGRKMFKAAGPLIRDERAAARFAGGGEEVGRIFNRELESAGESKFASAEKLGQFATEHVETLGKELGSMRRELDKLPDAERFHPKVADLLNVAMKEIGEPLAAKPMFEADAAAFGKALESVGVSTGYLKPSAAERASQFAIANPEARVSFEQYDAIRKALSEKAYRITNNTPSLNASPHIEDLRKLKTLWEDEFTKAAEQANAAAGSPEWREGYEALKKRYQATKIIADIAEDADLRANRNNTFGLTDYVLGAGALATGHPASAVAAGIGSKVAKAYGNQVLASLASDLAKTRFLQNTGASVDTAMTEGVRGFLGGAARVTNDTVAADAGAKASRGVRHIPIAQYDLQVRESQNAATNPRGYLLHASEEFAGIEAHDPGLFHALTSKTQRAAAFLASKVPTGTVDARSLTPHLETPLVSDAEKATYLTYVRAVRRPLSVIEDMKNGSLVPEEVEAIKAVYPKLYDRLQGMVGEVLRSAKTKPSYAAVIRLGILFDAPTDATLDPTFIADIQKTYAPTKNQNQGAPAPGPGAGISLNLASAFRSKGDERTVR